MTDDGRSPRGAPVSFRGGAGYDARVILECSHCGAPLDVKEGSRLVRCTYCKVTTERTRMRTLHPERPVDFRPPVVWTPPVHVPADSNVTLAYQKNASSGAGCLVGVILLSVVGVIAGVIFASAKRGGLGIGGASKTQLAALKLDKGPGGLGDKLGANVSETSIYVKLDDPRYEYLTMSWDKEHPDAPTSFYFGIKKGQKAPAGAAEKLAMHLRGGLDKNHSWSWHGVYFSLAEDGHFHGSVRPIESGTLENKQWRQQIDLLYRVAVADVLGVSTKFTEDELRELLAGGYPLADVGKLDPQLSVDVAEKTVLEKFPGARRGSSGSGVNMDVPVDHPWLLSLELAWPNQKGGVLESLSAHPAGGYDQLGPRVGDFARCLTKTFGAPKVNDTDYLKKKKSYDFKLPGDMTVTLNEYSLTLRAGWGDKKIDRQTLQAFTKALDGCR